MASGPVGKETLAWRIEIADESETQALAERVAGWLRPGDGVALSGDLGVGKTSFARALIRAITGEADLETPSPTFTIVQSYESPKARILHADFYRLRSPVELENLGWGEMQDGAISVIEWPERASEASPADSIHIRLEFEGSHDRRRVATIVGGGAHSARVAKERAVIELLHGAKWAKAERQPLHGDASARSYERLIADDGETAILMSSPARADGPPVRYGKSYATIAKITTTIGPFLAMTEGLRALRYSVPKILAADAGSGLALLEDFGDETIAGKNGPKSDRYAEAAALLGDLHGRSLPESVEYDGFTHVIPTYDIDAMSIEVELALDWYAPSVAGVVVSSGVRAQFLSLWRERLEGALKADRTWCLRDYHSPNIHWLEKRDGIRRLGLIDYQDTVWGPMSYDLASLLQDARVDLPSGQELRLLAAYLRRRSMTTPGFDQAQFLASYALMGAQRATKILGGFARSDRRDGKSQYLKHLPRIEKTLAKNLSHPSLQPLLAWFETHLPHAIGLANVADAD